MNKAAATRKRGRPRGRKRVPRTLPKDRPRFTTYLTRKMPIRVHRELQRLSQATQMTIQDVLTSCLEVGIRFYNQDHGFLPLPENVGDGIDWDAVPDTGTGYSVLDTKGE